MENELLSIRQVAEMLGVTTATLRRWDASGKLKAIRGMERGHRYYRREELSLFIEDLPSEAKKWAVSGVGYEPPSNHYSPNSAVFTTRLTKMEKLVSITPELKPIQSLIGAVAGEIGNNSFDHNLGNWPDISGVFFAYDLSKKVVVLADRGLGVLQTLKRALPQLSTHEEAVHIAFTERVTGRAPESRGNGLKFVRKVISEYPLSLVFSTGDVILKMEKLNPNLNIIKSEEPMRGCLAIIKF